MANVVADAFSRKEIVKSRQVRAMSMTIQDQQMENKEDDGLYVIDRGWDSIDRYELVAMYEEGYSYLSLQLSACSKVKAETSKTLGYVFSTNEYTEVGNGIETPWILSLSRRDECNETTDKVVMIKESLKAARDRQKSYVDNRRKPLEFEVGDQVLQKVSPWIGVVRFGKKGKLTPRYVGPFKIIKRNGPIAY
ncbi:hypothetical protein Tco_0404881 [Tanacetum coccineum]